MSSKEGTTSGNSLDDSLTNIQWLCGLESSELLQARENAAQDALSNAILPDSPNPYSKPPYSYATLILLAINSTDDKKMTLQDIYKWIETNYPYYKKCKKAWKNSIRHNLSLHSFFLKEKRPLDLPGKGSYWSISPEGKKNIMQEVMKHAQPIVQNPLATSGQVCRNLRPILPKPAGEAQQYYNDNVPGVCSFANGKTVMPVVILPTNIYVELASKIANNKKNDLTFTVTQGQDSTIKVENNLPDTQQNTVSTGTVFTSLMEEILRNKNFSEALDSFKTENLATTASNVNQENCEPAIKKIKKENNLTPCSIVHVKKTPLKDRTLPTLAAMNTAPCNDSGIFDKDSKIQEFNSLILTPAHLSTPKGTIAASQIPVQSSPLSTFHSGLTPLKYDSDSGFFTPLREADFDFLLSPNQLSLDQLTPARFNSTPQGCRKSLKLGTVHEEMTDGMTWMQ